MAPAKIISMWSVFLRLLILFHVKASMLLLWRYMLFSHTTCCERMWWTPWGKLHIFVFFLSVHLWQRFSRYFVVSFTLLPPPVKNRAMAALHIQVERPNNFSRWLYALTSGRRFQNGLSSGFEAWMIILLTGCWFWPWPNLMWKKNVQQHNLAKVLISLK